METLTLEFNPNITARILELQSSFSTDELKIIQEDVEFQKNKQKLYIALSKIKNGTADCCSLNELDEFLEKAISEYED